MLRLILLNSQISFCPSAECIVLQIYSFWRLLERTVQITFPTFIVAMQRSSQGCPETCGEPLSCRNWLESESSNFCNLPYTKVSEMLISKFLFTFRPSFTYSMEEYNVILVPWKHQGEFSAQLGNYIANNKQTTHQNKTCIN